MESSTSTAGDSVIIESASKSWWILLLIGIAWMLVGVVVLQFDQASVTTVGIIVGLMFIGTGLQNLVLASVIDHLRWLWAIFGVLFIAAGIVAFISPQNTFAAVADILGFIFMIIGIFWIIEALAARELNDLWWFGLIAGIFMVVIAFWTAGQFFFEKAYMLLVFAGIWSLMQGVMLVARSFQLKALGKYL